MADFTVLFPKIDSKLSVSVLDINMEYAINDVPSLYIRLKSSVSDKKTFSLLSEASLKIGGDIVVKGGDVEIFKGIIVGLAMAKDREAFIEVSACSELFKLTQGLASVLFKKTPKDEDIVKKLTEDAGVALTIEGKALSLAMHPHYFCYQQSPWRVLMSRIFENGALLVPGLKANKLINADEKALPEKTIDMDASGVTSFTLGTNPSAKFDAASSSTWDIAKQDFEKKDAKPLANLKLLGEQKSILGSAKLNMITCASWLPEQAEAMAQSQQIYRDLDAKQGSMSFDLSNIKDSVKKTLLALELLDQIKIKGVDNKSAEGYVITSIRHRNEGSRWIMDIDFGLSLRKTVDSDFYKLPPLPNMIGKVAEFKEGDKDGENGYNQVSVLFKMFELQEPINARPMSLFATKKEGLVFQPNKDDEVIIGFIDGDCRSPVVLGYCHNKAHGQPEKYDAANPVRGIFLDKTGDGEAAGKLGVKFVNKEPTIEVYLGENDKLSMTEKEGIKIARENESLTLFEDVKIDGKGEISLNNAGKNITVTTDKNLVITATETEIK